MGTKGTTDSFEYLMGINTVKLIKKIKDCSVLIVPDEHEFVVPKQIAFTTDLKGNYSNTNLELVSEMALLHHSRLNVL